MRSLKNSQDFLRILEEFLKNSSGILEEFFKNFQGGEQTITFQSTVPVINAIAIPFVDVDVLSASLSPGGVRHLRSVSSTLLSNHKTQPSLSHTIASWLLLPSLFIAAVCTAIAMHSSTPFIGVFCGKSMHCDKPCYADL